MVQHGSSSPAYPIPTMNWADWPERQPFELTGMGMRQQYLLGRELRRRYNEHNMLNQSLLLHQTMARSIDHNSSTSSAQAFLRGFVNQTQVKLKDTELPHAKPPMPVKEYFVKNIRDSVLPYGFDTLPFHTHFPHEEDIFAHCSCSAANNLTYNTLVNSTDVKEILRLNEEAFVAIVKSHFDINEKLLVFPKYIPLLESILATKQQYRDNKLNATEQEFVQKFWNKLFLHERSGNLEANKYRAAPMLQHIKNFFSKAIEKAMTPSIIGDNLKISFLFTEDNMLSSLLSHLGYNVTNSIPPASIVSFEVYGPMKASKNTTDYYVKMFYNDRELPIGNCPLQYCTMPNFEEELPKLSRDEIKQWCNKNTTRIQ
jgi:hypothetical protein